MNLIIILSNCFIFNITFSGFAADMEKDETEKKEFNSKDLITAETKMHLDEQTPFMKRKTDSDEKGKRSVESF